MSTLPLTHQHTSSLNVAHMHTCTYAHTQTCKTFDYWQIERIQACPFVQLWDCYVITTNSTIYVYVSLLFQFVTFCSLQDRENAECLVFINFLSQHNLTLTPALDKTLVMGRLWGDRYTFNIRKGDPLHQPSEMACTVLSLSLLLPLLDESKRENEVSTVSLPDTLGRMRFFSACLFSLLNLVSVCEFLPLVSLSSNTRLHETWRAV